MVAMMQLTSTRSALFRPPPRMQVFPGSAPHTDESGSPMSPAQVSQVSSGGNSFNTPSPERQNVGRAGNHDFEIDNYAGHGTFSYPRLPLPLSPRTILLHH